MDDGEGVFEESRPSLVVPKDVEENIAFRRKLLGACNSSSAARRDVIEACRRDIVFFANTLVWTFDPKRHPDQPNRPFIAWDFQEEVLREIDESIGHRDRAIVKSRDVGGSWMPLIAFDRRLLMFKSQTLGVMSRTEKLVANLSDEDSLFWKLNYMHEMMPDWLTRGVVVKVDPPSITNSTTRSSIIGASTTGDAGRGGRKQGILMDEYAAFDTAQSFAVLAATQHNTRCRIFVSTPNGIGNGFHKVVEEGRTKVRRIHWSQHPIHGIGLYRSDDVGGRLELVDKKFWSTATVNDILRAYPDLDSVVEPSDKPAIDNYPFVIDGKLRSPYYDYECLRCPVPSLIAQELDMDFIGSGAPFYDPNVIRSYVLDVCTEPYRTGEMVFEDGAEDVRFEQRGDGRMQIWFVPNARGGPALDRTYAIGVDVSQGGGASNSCISVGDCSTRSIVAKFTTPNMRPEAFASYVFAVGQWFGEPKVIFEGSGPGSTFGAKLIEMGYPSLYWQTRTERRAIKKPGWFPEDDAKRNAHTAYAEALSKRMLTNPDRTSVEECLNYQFTTDRKITHVASIASPDPSGARSNHGDRAAADVMLWKLMSRIPQRQMEKVVVDAEFAHMFNDSGDDEESLPYW